VDWHHLLESCFFFFLQFVCMKISIRICAGTWWDWLLGEQRDNQTCCVFPTTEHRVFLASFLLYCIESKLLKSKIVWYILHYYCQICPQFNSAKKKKKIVSKIRISSWLTWRGFFRMEVGGGDWKCFRASTKQIFTVEPCT